MLHVFRKFGNVSSTEQCYVSRGTKHNVGTAFENCYSEFICWYLYCNRISKNLRNHRCSYRETFSYVATRICTNYGTCRVHFCPCTHHDVKYSRLPTGQQQLPRCRSIIADNIKCTRKILYPLISSHHILSSYPLILLLRMVDEASTQRKCGMLTLERKRKLVGRTCV
jgi:hypothetical protein